MSQPGSHRNPWLWNVFFRPLMVAVLEAVGKYEYAPKESFSAGELREVIEGTGLAVTRRTGILSLPGPFRMLDLVCSTRRIPTAGLLPLVIRPFDALETRFRWPGFFGYLIAMVPEKPVRA